MLGRTYFARHQTRVPANPSHMKINAANRTRSLVILQRRDMSRNYHTRQGAGGICWVDGFIGVAVLLALLAARSVPPQFASTTNPGSSIHVVSSHDQRPRFSFDESRWSLPAGGLQPLQCAATSRQIAPNSPLFSSLQARGLHYNRPPPAV